MPVLSVDLACRSWSDLGVVVLEQKGSLIACEIIRWDEPYPPPVVELALRLNQICVERGAGVLMLDGPQAWKSEESEHSASSASERTPNLSSQMAPGSTLPESPLPGSYERFVGYCLALYDALGRLGWQRLATRERPGAQNSDAPQKILVESYPQAAWKSLGIPPLPPKQQCRVSHLAEAYAALTGLLPITTSQPPNHDQLQAIVGGLPGLAIEDRNDTNLRTETMAGTPATERGNDRWNDGFIVMPVPPKAKHIPWLTPD